MSEEGNNNFIVLHLGAGYHCSSKESQYLKLCTQACKLGIKLLDKGEKSIDVVTKVCSFLEDSTLTNAGFGSNLTQDGNVECDAGIMSSKSDTFAGVTGIKSVKNPIKLAKIILQEQNEKNIHGLIPPMVLSGDGAKNKAILYNLDLVDNDTLISKEAEETFKRYKRKLQNNENQNNKKNCIENTNFLDSHFLPQDTIGVICVDNERHLASGISSGGIALKQSGRVGHAAHFGSGCWAFTSNESTSIASCTSGCGEYLIRTNLAKEAAEYCLEDTDEVVNYNKFVEKYFLDSPYLKTTDQKLCGFLVVKLFKKEKFVDIHVAHTTDSFCVGYMTSNMKQPQTIMSRLPSMQKVLSQGMAVKL